MKKDRKSTAAVCERNVARSKTLKYIIDFWFETYGSEVCHWNEHVRETISNVGSDLVLVLGLRPTDSFGEGELQRGGDYLTLTILLLLLFLC